MLKQLLLFIIFVISFCSNAQELEVAKLHIEGNKRLKTSFIHLISDTKAGVKLDSTTIEQDVIRFKTIASSITRLLSSILFSRKQV